MSYKYKDKEAKLETDNLYVAQKILAEPERYKAGSLMQVWAILIVSNENERLRLLSEDATTK